MGIFRAYRFDTIREIADSVRKDFTRNPNQIPVDVERIIEFGLGIRIRPVDNLKSHLDMEAMLSKDMKVIFIDENSFNSPSFDNRTRFSLARELGHYFLHKDFYKEAKFDSPEEWINYLMKLDPNDLEWYEKHANEFAGRLLVPINPLIEIVSTLHDELKSMGDAAVKRGIKDPEELMKWKRYAIASKIAMKFKVSPQTIEMRLRKEKIHIE
ncbi:MAG: ImmA/IrrE family metallo-endopeptidase [Cyclobacteriaceae bacterium]|nr:ImmA/IrrE family metallo-endopeptidase [Cyclobacteriaceae bacterium]